MNVLHLQVATPPVRIVISGQDGIGKTTFLHQIAAEWGKAVCSNVRRHYHCPNIVEGGYELLQEDFDEIFDRFNLVIPLDLALVCDEVTEEKPKELLRKLINSQLLFLSSTDRSFLVDYMFKCPQNILLLLDNINCCSSKAVVEILNGNTLGKCTCVITSRKEDIDPFGEMFCLWKYQLKGITLSQAREMATYFVDNTLNDSCKIKVLADMFQDIGLHQGDDSIEDLNDLAPGLNAYPPVLHASCVMWQQRQKTPFKWTSFCERLVAYTLACHQKRISGLVARNALLQEYQSELLSLGKIAYDAAISENSNEIFRRKKIEESYDVTERCWDIGLLVGPYQSNPQDQEVYVKFKLKCIMDYLAGIYLTTKTDDMSLEQKQEKFMSSCRTLDHILKRQMLISIICGLSSDTGNSIVSKCIKVAAKSQSEKNVASFMNFLLLCVREYNISNSEGPVFDLPETVTAEVTNNNLKALETLLSKKSRPIGKEKTVKHLTLHVSPKTELSGEMVERFVHPFASGPLQRLTIECKGKMKHDAYQQIYKEVNHMKQLNFITINASGNHKERHYFRSLLKNLSELENLANININIQ